MYMRLIPIECIREDSLLAKTIYDNNGIILLNKGSRLSESVKSKLTSLNIYSIYIDDEYSENEIEDIVKPQLRQKSISIIKETFSNIERLKDVDNLQSKRMLKLVNRDYFTYIHSIAEELLEDILSSKNVLISLVDIKSMDNQLYQHSVNVAIISLVMGISLKMRKEDLIELCLGALLHDIGKTFISKEIIMKNSEFTKEEEDKYQSHSIKGYEYLKEELSLNESSRRVILEHHERIDGLGYPYKIKVDKIHNFAKIVSIANVYDILTSDSTYIKAIQPSDALEFIMAHVNTLFDFGYVNIFSKIIIVYPAGTIVKLSNGDIGSVIGTPPNYPLRPNVRIIKSSNELIIGKTIKLLNRISLVIVSVEYDV